MMERLKVWIRSKLLRVTEPPYQCYWRDRALRAEAELRLRRNLLRL
jgi:hypothetical protein